MRCKVRLILKYLDPHGSASLQFGASLKFLMNASALSSSPKNRKRNEVRSKTGEIKSPNRLPFFLFLFLFCSAAEKQSHYHVEFSPQYSHFRQFLAPHWQARLRPPSAYL